MRWDNARVLRAFRRIVVDQAAGGRRGRHHHQEGGAGLQWTVVQKAVACRVVDMYVCMYMDGLGHAGSIGRG